MGGRLRRTLVDSPSSLEINPIGFWDSLENVPRGVVGNGYGKERDWLMRMRRGLFGVGEVPV